MQSMILAKHSLPEIDLCRPAHEWRLSAAGQDRCSLLADRLVRFDPRSIISSDEPKAVETADLVATRLRLETTIEPDLHEHGRAGVPWMDDADWQRTMIRFFRRPNDLVFGEETADQALKRFSSAIDRIFCGPAGEQTVIVSHGRVISLFAAAKTGIDGYLLWKYLQLPSFVVFSMSPWAIEKIDNLGYVSSS